MWRETRQNLEYHEGFYLFGGMDDRNVVHNDLWLIRPDYYFNKDALSLSDTDFVGDYQLGMCLSKIEDFSGMPPCPRTQFQMTHLCNPRTNQQLLIIYGGRNDAIFMETNNIALNDICIFNINSKTWEALAIFGQMPCSRWSHFITQVRGDTREDCEGFVMFGGVNLTSYCKSSLWNFTLHTNDKTKTPKKKLNADDFKVRDSLFGTGIYE